MAETITRVLEMVRDRLDEPTARQWTDRQLRGWILDGSRDIARKSLQLLETVAVVVTAGAAEYTVSHTILEIHAAYWTPTGDTRKIPLQPKAYNAMDNVWQSDRDTVRSDPCYFTSWGFSPYLKLRVWPVPSTNGTIELMVSSLPADFDLDGTEDAFTIGTPEGWTDLVVHYTEAAALRKDRDPRWQEAKALYDEGLQGLIDSGNALSQGSEIIYDGSGGFLPAWLVNDGGWY